MKLENWQLVALVVGAFAAVILIDIVLQYQSNEEFRNNFPLQPRARFQKAIAETLQQEEMEAPTETPSYPTLVEQETTSEEADG